MRRELFRTLDALGKMRKAELGTPNEQGVTDVANPPAAASDAEEVAEVMEAGADEEPDLPESVTMPEKAPNEPNLQSTQVTVTQSVKPENAVSEPPGSTPGDAPRILARSVSEVNPDPRLRFGLV